MLNHTKCTHTSVFILLLSTQFMNPGITLHNDTDFSVQAYRTQ